MFISEFGACMDTESCVQEITSVTEVCDEHLVGWAYWQLKTFGDLTTSAGTGSEGFYNTDGTLQSNKVQALTRTYLPYTQGTLLSMNFNTSNANFVATFSVDTSIVEPTVIFWSQDYWYPQGFNTALYDEQGAILSMQGGDYKLDFSSRNYAKLTVINQKLNGQTLKLQLRAKYISIE